MKVALTAAALVAALSVAAHAQQAQPMRVAGKVSGIDNSVVAVKDSKGEELKIHVPANLAVIAVAKGTLADVKQNSFIGVGATPQADGSQKAVELRSFPKPQEDGGHFYEGDTAHPMQHDERFCATGHGDHRATGGADATSVVKYPQGEKRIVIPVSAHVVRNASGFALEALIIPNQFGGCPSL